MAAGTGARRRVGVAAAAGVFALFAGIALWIDPVDVRRTPADPTAVPGFQSDEATYYLMGHSLVQDFDLEYRREDIERTRREFPLGPEGVFLKQGVTWAGAPDPDRERLYFGKSFVYPLAAAPFVAVFGTTGFYILNSLLLAVGFFCAYVFVSARNGMAVSLLLTGGLLFPTVVPVYWAWITPELFNCVLGLVAYFCWLYKFVAPPASSRWTAWLRGPGSDVAAALLIGVLTFSKPTNALLGAPLGLWWLWQRDWRRAAMVAAAFVLSAGVWSGANAVMSGEVSYQGGARATCTQLTGFPFEMPGTGLEICGLSTTSEAMTDVWFDRQMFWINLRANLAYYVVGRYGGLLPYFFPVIAAVAAFLVSRRQRQAWQWLVLAGIVVQVFAFLIMLPYTYFGGGGSVGNRYFMGVYGTAIFLYPPIRSIAAALVPWLVGGLFMWPLVISPFDTSVRPGDRAFRGPLRLLPVERTNYLDLPVQTEGPMMLRWFGATPSHPGFQLLYLDKNSWLREADKLSFWTRGASRAELLVRTNEPERRIAFTLKAGPLPTTVDLELDGQRASVSLAPGQTAVVQMAPPRGFPYKNRERDLSYIWHLAITTDSAFIPAEVEPDSKDTRQLGVLVTPLIVR